MKPSYPNFFGSKIVIVEDDLPTLSYYQAIFIDTHANIVILKTGQEFLDYIGSAHGNNIDIVIMDYLIPIVNGIDCVRIFRKKNKNTPVIMLTAYASEQTKAEAFVAGCNEYILKPIYPAKIFFLLKKYLSKTYETDLSKKHPGRENSI